jgi:hypothetical protein
VYAKGAGHTDGKVISQTYPHGVTLTKDPDARMTLGGSSGGAAAFTMAWFHPELYHRVLCYSGTFVNQQSGPDAPHGAWSYHEQIIPNSDVKPIRAWLHVSERDNGAGASGAGLHNWVLANKRMADVLKAKGYHYSFSTRGRISASTNSAYLPETVSYSSPRSLPPPSPPPLAIITAIITGRRFSWIMLSRMFGSCRRPEPYASQDTMNGAAVPGLYWAGM